MIVDHHMGQYVALPFRPAGENHRSDSVNVVEMLGENAVKGRGLDKSALTRLNRGEWSKDMTISVKAEKPSSQPKTNESKEKKNCGFRPVSRFYAGQAFFFQSLSFAYV